MTIGKFGHDYSTGPNPDFVALIHCHENICKLFNLKSEELHMSMGMSDDFEEAVRTQIIRGALTKEFIPL